MKQDLSYLGCKWHPQAYDADICEDCIYDDECYARFLRASKIIGSGKPVKDAFGKMNKTE